MSITQTQVAPHALDTLDTVGGVLKIREVAEGVAKRLGLSSVEEAGIYASGKAILPALCTNALNALKDEGKVYKGGWGRWTVDPSLSVEQVKRTYDTSSTPAPSAPAPSAPEPSAPEPIASEIISAMVEKAEADVAFDLSDPMTLDWVISQQSCWGTFSKRDSECNKCLLSTACKASKAEVKARKAEEKAEEELKTAWAVPSDVDVSTAMKLTTQKDLECVASGETLPKGSEVIFIEGWGVVTPKVASDLGVSL